ncbi:hypothetical protein ACFSKW_06410 [Nonomuraea mangrovi]|uniref:Uncharacterized protein n=1 Tax=Nonomuraea mangrovi TaxID=2316207 RepID=A0ABW4SRT9_9ACTN
MTTLLHGPATAFDEPVVALSPPAELFNGRAAALQVTDLFHRGDHIMGRFEGSGLVGFKVAAGGRRLRVKVVLSVDATSVPGWHLPEGPGEVRAAHLPPRLLQVRAQGRLRQCVLLKGGKGTMSARVVFDLMPEEVPDDGLVCVEVLDIAEGRDVSREVRDAMAGTIMDGGAAGVRIDRVAFEECPDGAKTPLGEAMDGARCEVVSLVSSGGLAHLNRRGTRPLRTGLFVVNPVPPGVFGSGGRLTVRLGSRADTSANRPATARDRALMRRALLRVGGEAKRVRHAAREAMCSAAPYVEGVMSVQDGGLTRPVRSTDGNTLELDLPAPVASPLLVVVAPREGAVPTLVSASWIP